jgi:hypothetical protein
VRAFTPDFEVLSVNFALPEETDDQQLFSIQRSFGADAEDEDKSICLVLSPSQQCAYEPFESVVLARSFLGLKLTSEAASVFGVRSIRIAFSVEESLFRDVREGLSTLFQGEPVLHHEPAA